MALRHILVNAAVVLCAVLFLFVWLCCGAAQVLEFNCGSVPHASLAALLPTLPTSLVLRLQNCVSVPSDVGQLSALASLTVDGACPPAWGGVMLPRLTSIESQCRGAV